MQIFIENEIEMQKLGKALAQVLEENDVIYLIGDLGVGKTTLTKGIAKGLGYRGRVNSPSFTLMNIYESAVPIYHLDFYRLDSHDIFDLGLEDYVGRKGISIIEWPEVGKNVLPLEAIIINILLVDDDYDKGRLVKISALNEKYIKKIKELGIIVGASS